MVVALRALGYDIYDKPHYDRRDGLQDMLSMLVTNGFYQKNAEQATEPGDLILIRSNSMYHHLVYLTEFDTIIHAWFTTGINRVVESTMLPEWTVAIHSVWRFKDLP